MTILPFVWRAPVSRWLTGMVLLAGKPAKVVIVACMRKLLTIMNATLKTNTPWRSEHA